MIQWDEFVNPKGVRIAATAGGIDEDDDGVEGFVQRIYAAAFDAQANGREVIKEGEAPKGGVRTKRRPTKRRRANKRRRSTRRF